MNFLVLFFVVFFADARRSQEPEDGAYANRLNAEKDLFPPMCSESASRPNKFKITSPFGPRRDPVYGGGGNHQGCDLRATADTPLAAVDDGVVTKAVDSFRPNSGTGYGNQIEIKHKAANGSDYYTKFGHLKKVFVKKDDKVKRGQIIGTVDSTGKSTGDHLHFEVITCTGRGDDEKGTCKAENPQHFFDLRLVSKTCDELRDKLEINDTGDTSVSR